MGGYSSDSDGDYSRKSKKKKKKRSRSRSRSSSGESSINRRNKHKKSKKSKHRRARSRSRDRRSRSRDRRSRSRGRRSRSKDRRSRSRDRRSRSREKRRGRSRDRHSRSRSRSYSKYRSRTQSRSRSRERSRRSRSRDKHRQSDQQNLKTTEVDPCASVPGFNNMTPAQQSRIRMEMALKAAAAADEKLKEQGLLPHGLGRTTESTTATLTVQDQQERVKTIEDIESEGFAPTAFKSTRGQESSSKVTAHPMTDVNHEAAMFGFTSLPAPTKGIKYKETDNFMHPNLYVTAEEKMEKWIQKLTEYRKQKLEGEAMS